MNYLLKQIIEICDDAPPASGVATLAQFQERLEELDEALVRIVGLAHKLQRILDGEAHLHVAGTLADLNIDTCAVCGLDIRNQIHSEATK